MQHPIRSTLRKQPGSSFADTGPRHGAGGPGDDGHERAVLVAVLVPDTKADLRDPLAELAALTESADVEVVDALVQKRMRLSTAGALGKGKVEELAARVDAAGANVVIFDNDLTPRQIRNLEKTIRRKVIDRSELILDIFARRAKTREAQLQVELAQLEYTAPRLRGMWTHLERIAGAGGGTSAGAVGGVGTRGPGERQIEIDRRIVKHRLGALRRQIAEIHGRKRHEVRSRADEFTVSLVGYTNSGKSTLMNRLTSADRFAADLLFATLDTKTVRWDFGHGRHALLSDTVGFVRDLPHGLIASFRATLEEAIHADLLLHVVDVSSPTALQQVESVDEVLDDLGCGGRPRITLLNKVDVAKDPTVAEMVALRVGAVSERPRGSDPPAPSHDGRSRDGDSGAMPILRISAKTGAGLDALVRTVEGMMRGRTVDVTLRVPHAAGRLLSELGRRGDIRDRRYLSDGVELDVRIDRAQLVQLRGQYRALTIIDGDVGGAGDDEGCDRG